MGGRAQGRKDFFSKEIVAKNAHLKKHAAAIQCSNSLSLLQRKISNALLFNAYYRLLEEEEHAISVRRLCEIVGYRGKNTAAIKEAVVNLLSTVLEWNVVDEKKMEDWTASSILASVNIKDSICTYAYSPRIKRLLYSPSMYGKISMIMQSHFRSSYGLALYENCVRYRDLPHTKWFEMSIFRKLMGVPDELYGIFRDFKRRVIDKAVQEVNTHSDLIIEPEYLRKGKQIDKIRLLIRERPKKTRIGCAKSVSEVNNSSVTSKENAIVISLLDIFGLSRQKAVELVNQHSASFVEEKMNLVMASASFREGRVRNITGLLLDAVKSDYKSPVSSELLVLEEQRKKTEENKKKQAQEREVAQLQYEYAKLIEEKIDSHFMNISNLERSKILEAFKMCLQEQGNLFVLDLLEKNGLENIMVMGMLRHYIRENSMTLGLTLQSFEAFSRQFVESVEERGDVLTS